MKTVVIHHSADFDGIFCREIARKHFGPTAAHYIGWDYGDPAPSIPSSVEHIYMLDISIESHMDDPRLIWIDHHKSAIEKYGPRPGLQMDGVAACRLAWQYWFGTGDRVHDPADAATIKHNYIERVLDEPLAVRLAGEFDVWDKRDERADYFQLGLKAAGDAADWSSLLSPQWYGDEYTNSVCNDGILISRYKTVLDSEIVNAYGFDVVFEGLTFLALNTARCNSLSFTDGIRPDHDGLLGFRFNGKKWMISLYGVPDKPDIDLSAIATKYGGGGHKQACGFQFHELPFL